MSPGNVARELSVIKTRSKSQQFDWNFESIYEPSQQPKRCQRMLHGAMAVTVADERPPSHQIPPGCWWFLGNRYLQTPDLTASPTMNLDCWPLIYAAIQQHLQKIYNGKNAALKERHWIPNSEGTYDLERIRLSRPSHISVVNWDAQIGFWNDPKNRARAAQNKQNRAKRKVICRQGSRSIAALRDMHMESSATKSTVADPIPSSDTTLTSYSRTRRTKLIYDEMLRLQGLGSNTETGVPYIEDEIMAIVRGGKQRGHIPGVGRVLP
ncbi:RNA-directed DNA polymerase, eukaryota [Tanacetum coccineum]